MTCFIYMQNNCISHNLIDLFPNVMNMLHFRTLDEDTVLDRGILKYDLIKLNSIETVMMNCIMTAMQGPVNFK